MMATASTWVRSICSKRCISYHRSWVLSCVWHKTHCHTTCEQLSPSAGSEHNLDTSRGRATVYLHIRLCISAMLRILVFIIILWLKELLHLKRSNFIIFQALKFYLFYQQIKSFRLKLDFKSDKSFLQQVSKYQQVLYVKSFFEGPEGGNWCLKNNPEHCKQAHFAPLYLIEWQTAKKKGFHSQRSRQLLPQRQRHLWKWIDLFFAGLFILLNVYYIWNIDLDGTGCDNEPLCWASTVHICLFSIALCRVRSPNCH